jgi:hypothetical protein
MRIQTDLTRVPASSLRLLLSAVETQLLYARSDDPELPHLAATRRRLQAELRRRDDDTSARMTEETCADFM